MKTGNIADCATSYVPDIALLSMVEIWEGLRPGPKLDAQGYPMLRNIRKTFPIFGASTLSPEKQQ